MENRLEILKTYKIFIGGEFPRTESGRYYKLINSNNKVIANLCRSSQKDVKNAVSAATKVFKNWSEKTAFNRSQILYRIAEMLEGRKDQFITELMLQGSSKVNAIEEVNLSIDRIIYYAGWCDKYSQVFSSVNPVSSSHFNFTKLEPMGIVGIIAPKSTSLIGLVSTVMPIIAGGNVCVVLASEEQPLCAITFAEIIHSSDVPGGVFNIVTGYESELKTIFGSHMEINALLYGNPICDNFKEMQKDAVMNLKRVFNYDIDWRKQNSQNPYFIIDFQEIKTTWHPVDNYGSSSNGY